MIIHGASQDQREAPNDSTAGAFILPKPAIAIFESPRTEKFALLLCFLAGLIPIWSVRWFPSVDGPMHLYIVHVIERLAQPGTNVFDQIFEFNYNIEPNLAVYGIIWSLSAIFPILTAEKLFVSLYWLLFISGAYYLLRSFGPRSSVLSLMLLPFALGYFLHWGFYNFVLSQALFLIAAGYTIRHADHPNWRHIVVFSLLMLALALTHLVGIMMFLFYLGLFRTGIALRDGLAPQAGEGWPHAARKLARDASLLLLAALPALAIIGSFLLRRVLSDGSAATGLSMVQKIWYVASVSPIFALDKREAIAWGAFTLVLWLLALRLLMLMWKDHGLRLRALPVVLPPALLIGFVVIGSLGFAGFEALPRLLPFLFIMMITALGVMRVGTAWRGTIMLAVVVGLIATSLMRVPSYRQINDLYADFAKSRQAPPAGSAVLAFNTTDKQREVDGYPTGWRVNVTDHFRSRYARENDLILLNLVHLSPKVFGYFPAAFKPHVIVAPAYSAKTFKPPARPLQNFEQTSGMPIREVSFWPSLQSEPGVKFFIEEREPLLRAELADSWQLLPHERNLAPYVYSRKAPTR